MQTDESDIFKKEYARGSIGDRIRNKTFWFSVKLFIKFRTRKIVLRLVGIEPQNFEYDVKKLSNTQQIIDEFHKLYYNNEDQTFQNTFWMGNRVFKSPFDLWIYQEILFKC